MDVEELISGLIEIISTKDIRDIKDFIYILYKSDYQSNGDETYEIDDIEEYLYNIERYFEDKSIFNFEPAKPFEKNPYAFLKPCFVLFFTYPQISEILAQKLEELPYTSSTRVDVIDTISVLLHFAEIQDGAYYVEDSNESEEEEELEPIEQFEIETQMHDEINYILKNAIANKISELSVKDFLSLETYGRIFSDSFFTNVVIEKIKQMNEQEFFKFIIIADVDNENPELFDITEEKLKELNSQALYNLYMYAHDLEGYNKQGRSAQIMNLNSLKSFALFEISMKSEKPKMIFEDTEGNLSDEWNPPYDINELKKSDKYMCFLEILQTLNNQEFTLYMLQDFDNSIFTKEEKHIVKHKLQQLSDIDFLMLFLEAGKNNPKLFKEEGRRRNLPNVKNKRAYGAEYTYLELTNAELDAIQTRLNIYTYINNYEDDLFTLLKPEQFPIEIMPLIEYVKDNLISAICELESCDDKQCISIINRLNQTEKSEDYVKCRGFLEYKLNGQIELANEELLSSFRKCAKYQLIQYMHKRMLSMPKGLIDMIHITENGIFNEMVEMCLDGTELYVKQNTDLERY